MAILSEKSLGDVDSRIDEMEKHIEELEEDSDDEEIERCAESPYFKSIITGTFLLGGLGMVFADVHCATFMSFMSMIGFMLVAVSWFGLYSIYIHMRGDKVQSLAYFTLMLICVIIMAVSLPFAFKRHD
jgi:magnesium-transporting ATPase (P-type)